MINGHFETVIPSAFFKMDGVDYTRERLELSDGDFLDIDWLKKESKQCLVISHGLEGGADRFYVKRTAAYFHNQGWDIAAWNCRSCSGEMNRLPRFYHHGDTLDLDEVVSKVLSVGYEKIVLFGYSMGGSMSLKYLGEASRDNRVIGATVFSVPCNLRDSAIQLTLKGNKFYEKRFLKKLKDKIVIKGVMHPELKADQLEAMTTFDEFHDCYTAPLHGFKDKEEFFQLATCDRYFEGISVPVLIVNALNDPMLGPKCYPNELARTNPMVYLETPKLGGHCGFTISGDSFSYMEYRSKWFIDHYLR
jgi:predicted alpha/beta-fold hydrolase